MSKCPQERLCSSTNPSGNLVLFMAVLVNLERTFAFAAGKSRVRPAPAACSRPLVDTHPAVRGQPLLRQEAALVVHLPRAAHPIAEIDVGEAHLLRPDDVI